MPTHFRAQIGWAVDSLLPKDQVTINPCFRHQTDLGSLLGADWQQLADDLAASIQVVVGTPARQCTVKLYNLIDPVPGTPHRPLASKILATGVNQASQSPGELALALSYYGGANGPHERGRLYLPYYFINKATTSLGNRPNSTDRTNAGAYVPVFAALGGSNVDWIVWSRTNKSATKVTNWYVDDEWDVVRSRGLRPSARTAGTTTA